MTDTGLIVDLGQGDLALDDVGMLTAGWLALDLSPLEHFPPLRGTNRILSGAAGRRARRKRVDQNSVDLPMWITGAWNPIEDEPHDDPVLGLVLNLDYLWENVASPPSGATRTAVRTLTDLSTRTAPVQVAITVGDKVGEYDKPAILTITVPRGRLPIDTP